MSEATAVIKKIGAWLEVTRDGRHLLPEPVLQEICDSLTYDHNLFHRGTTRCTAFGQKLVMTSQRQKLFTIEDGRLCCMQGHFQRVRAILDKHHLRVVVLNRDPPLASRPRPNCYEQDWDRVYQNITFRQGQEECLMALAMHDMGVVDAVTAFGKMWVIAAQCLLYPYAKIDVTTYRRDVADGIYRLLTRFIPAIGRVGDGHNSPGLVTVYTAGSLRHARGDADILIADEVHELCTDAKMEHLVKYNYARMYAYTASLRTRPDNSWHRIEMVFGPTIYKIDYPTAEQHGLVASMTVLWLEIPALGENPIAEYTDDVARKRHGIWRNEIRNRKIAGAAQELFRTGHQVLILVDTIEHAVYLHRELPEFRLCYAENSLSESTTAFYRRHGFLLPSDPEMTAEVRDTMRRQFENREIMGVIATGVWAVGVSFTSLDVLIRANGGLSETENIQLPGRVCRIDAATGKQTGVVIDCMDRFDPTFERRSQSRRRAYHKQGWLQYNEDGAQWEPGRR